MQIPLTQLTDRATITRTTRGGKGTVSVQVAEGVRCRSWRSMIVTPGTDGPTIIRKASISFSAGVDVQVGDTVSLASDGGFPHTVRDIQPQVTPGGAVSFIQVVAW